MTWSRTIPLDPPIAAEGGKVSEIRLREPLAHEVEAAEEKGEQFNGLLGFRTYQMALLSTVSGLDEAVVQKLPITAFNQASADLAGVVETGKADVKVRPGEARTDALDPPLVVNGITYDSLSLVEPAVEDVLHAEATMAGATTKAALIRYKIGLVHRAAEIPYPVARVLPISTLNRAAAFLAGFTSAGLTPGGS